MSEVDRLTDRQTGIPLNLSTLFIKQSKEESFMLSAISGEGKKAENIIITMMYVCTDKEAQR